MNAARMGPIFKEIEIEGQPAMALFDSGATYTYVRSPLVSNAPGKSVARPVHVLLGGKDVEIRELCIVDGKIEGLDFFTDAVPLDEIGQADGHNWMRSLALQQWSIGKLSLIQKTWNSI